MDIARGGDIEPCSANHRGWEAFVISFEIYDQLDDSALSSACDIILAYMPAFYDSLQTCLSYKRHKTWKSMVTRTKRFVGTVAK